MTGRGRCGESAQADSRPCPHGAVARRADGGRGRGEGQEKLRGGEPLIRVEARGIVIGNGFPGDLFLNSMTRMPEMHRES